MFRIHPAAEVKLGTIQEQREDSEPTWEGEGGDCAQIWGDQWKARHWGGKAVQRGDGRVSAGTANATWAYCGPSWK